MMRTTSFTAEILAVGSELLSPGFQDTNSLFVIERLDDLGIVVSFKTIVGDDPGDLAACLKSALRRSRFIIVMGGLGPTEDDRTREITSQVLKRRLVFDPAILERIRERFRRGNWTMTASNRKQSLVIEGAEVLNNPNGTAPGLWVRSGAHTLVLLPGPPRELKPMFADQVAPKLKAMASGITVRRVIRITGMGESMMEDRIRSVYPRLPKGARLITLSSPGELQIRFSIAASLEARRAAEEKLARLEKRLCVLLGNTVFSTSDESLEEVVGRLLAGSGSTVACAESCTGGLLGHRLTNMAGSSRYFLGSVVAYSNASKSRLLGVPASLINTHGAVSGEVVEAMALAIRRKTGADFALAVTGIAGPGGGSPAKPVGLVFTALAREDGVSVKKNVFMGERGTVKFLSSQKALDMLRRHLEKKPPEGP
jgi:nicotinamide-nucleotide amidase